MNRANLPAVFGKNAKININGVPPVRKANALNTQMPLTAPMAPTKPLAMKVSTKPSDRPMGQAAMRLKKSTAAVPPVPKLPTLAPKPPSSAPRSARTTRPKTGMK